MGPNFEGGLRWYYGGLVSSPISGQVLEDHRMYYGM